MKEVEVIVVGGGIVGGAIAFGLLQAGRRVLVLDGDDGDFRAARANFGLVWVQGKGVSMPAYQAATRESSDAWPDFLRDLTDVSGVAVDYERKGGLAFCLGEDEFEKRRGRLFRLHNQSDDCEMLERPRLEALLPGVALGPDVTGASFCWRDGHVNPLQLLAALHAAIVRLGGHVLAQRRVTRIAPRGAGFEVETKAESFTASRIVIAAGIASGDLAKEVNIDAPVRPQRGQILVTERMSPFLPLPASGLRQTAEGTVMIGATNEEVGYDASTTASAAATLASRALRIVPALSTGKLVRQWAGLRVMSPDSYPVYAESADFPGAFVALCHSGVTLAAFHAGRLAAALASGALPPAFEPFHPRRFDVQKSH